MVAVSLEPNPNPNLNCAPNVDLNLNVPNLCAPNVVVAACLEISTAKEPKVSKGTSEIPKDTSRGVKGGNTGVGVGTRLQMISNALPDNIFKALLYLPHVPNERKKRSIKEAHWLPVKNAAKLQLRSPRCFIEQVAQ